ncbi:hypothetical protein GCM10007291_42170 [Gemmobacter nanjingensis]|uniref:Glycosyltransferase 2-like domain-containing protein n=1 Tax=Gemmobacter nanjingensis TaxID=488454 RepID=A0ABQ3FSS7_9RHOB|nr:glycosyltransferase [Gemmobacter nanjingensis]GHC36277.1 hypothetical protein GCM10007291_42170 [Gemmobacter nanjingensis]
MIRALDHLSAPCAVSVIVPCHNAMGKIGRCLSALRQVDLPEAEYEVIFVDDCSTDGTFDLLTAECAREPNWRVLRVEANSGSPSEPRNRGIAAAQGEYVFFLDCDDEILPDTLRVYLAHARKTGADILRGNLIAEDRNGRREMNQIKDWSDGLSRTDRIRAIIGGQSTIPCSLIRRDLIQHHRLRWRHDIRMGEDTLFLVAALAAAERIEYIDHPTYIYVKTPNFTPSSTQSYGERELRDHLAVWRGATALLRPLGIDYISLRLQVGLQTALRALIFVNRGDVTKETFADFSAFLAENASVIERFSLSQRLRDLLAVARNGDFVAFRRACRPRLLIAGYDLKFITGMLDQLEPYYDISLDVWPGHDRHDEAASRAALEKAELIWCEWLLGNAVWYARNCRPDQIIIARMHRFELGRDFGADPAIERLNTVVAVSTLFLERLLERFPTIPRHKARLLHNYVDLPAYRHSADPDRRFRLGVIGILPARKGFARSLELLARLRRVDPRYTLDVYGKAPQDLDWLARIPTEMAYFKDCEELVARNALKDAVHFHGHVDLRSALAQTGTGIILSQSDPDPGIPGPESFHLAVADGFACGGVSLVQYWQGAEFIWPERFILPDEDALVERILAYRDDPALFEQDAIAGRDFTATQYDTDRFVTGFRALFRQAV